MMSRVQGIDANMLGLGECTSKGHVPQVAGLPISSIP